MVDITSLKARLAKLRLGSELDDDPRLEDPSKADLDRKRGKKKQKKAAQDPYNQYTKNPDGKRKKKNKLTRSDQKRARAAPKFKFPTNLERNYDISGHDITSRKMDSTKGVSSKIQGFDHNKRVPPRYTYKGIRTPDGKLVKRKYKPGTSGGKHTDDT